MSDFNSLVQYTVENISRPVKYIIYKLTEFIRVVDKFVFRQVPSGAASGYATIEKIEGNTVKFNQLVNGAFDNLDHWTRYTITASVNNNVLSFVKSTSGAGYLAADIAIITGHKYYYSALINQPDGFTLGIGFVGSANANYGRVTPTVYGSFERISNVFIGDSSYEFAIRANNASIGTALCRDVVLIDLTAIFGAGNEPSTVADFEAWRDQNGLPSVADYNAGELLNVKMSGMQTEDSSQQTLDTLPFDVTTITGINTTTNVREVIFASGMKSAGSVHDILTASEADKKLYKVKLTDLTWINSSTTGYTGCFSASLPIIARYRGSGSSNQSNQFINSLKYPKISYYKFSDNFGSNYGFFAGTGKFGGSYSQALVWIKDPSVANVSELLTALQGIEMVYEISPYTTYTDLQDGNGNPLNPRYKVEQGGTEQVLPVNASTPTTVAPTLTTTYTKDVH